MKISVKGWAVVVDGQFRFILGNTKRLPVRSVKNLAKLYKGKAIPVTITDARKARKK